VTGTAESDQIFQCVVRKFIPHPTKPATIKVMHDQVFRSAAFDASVSVARAGEQPIPITPATIMARFFQRSGSFQLV
jgi:hypothetical protein